MSRYDKYDPVDGGFRAPLEANFGYTSGAPDFAHADLGLLKVVSLNANGRVVIGYAVGVRPVGVLLLTEPKAAAEIVDVMTDGEIVEFTLANGAAAAAGTTYSATQAGSYAAAAPTGALAYIGHTVEASRLVVRFNRANVVGV